MDLPDIAWHASAYTPDGYGDEARGFLRALEGSGASPSLRDLSTWTKERAGLSAEEVAQLKRQRARYSSLSGSSRSVHVHHYVPGPALQVLKVDGALNVSRSTFETDRIPHSWLPYLAQMDEIWVPTQFNVQTYSRSGIPEEKIRVVGQTLDFDLFNPDTQVEPLDIPGVPQDSFVFLANFDFSERKGWRQLLEAWSRAFSSSDPVCLLLKTTPLSFPEEYIRRRIESFLPNADRTAPVVIYSQMLDAGEMPRLYASADAYVLPSRGEGWGRPYMEALAMNMPTIASRWSGQLFFMSPDYSWLVDGEVVPVPEGAEVANSLYRGHQWFEADVDSLAGAMQEVASDPVAASQKASGARERLLSRFAPQQLAERTAYLASDLLERKRERLARPEGRIWVQERPESVGTACAALALQSKLEEAAEAVYRIRGSQEEQSLKAVAGIFCDYPSLSSDLPLICFIDQGVSPPDEVLKVLDYVDLVVAPGLDRQGLLVEAGIPNGLIVVVDRASWKTGGDYLDPADAVLQELQLLSESGVAPVRSVSPAQIETGAQPVLWVPDLTGDYLPDFKGWQSRSGEAETLVIWPEGSPEAIDELVGRLEGALTSPAPDVLLLEPEGETLPSVALACTHILTGPGSLLPPGAARRLIQL